MDKFSYPIRTNDVLVDFVTDVKNAWHSEFPNTKGRETSVAFSETESVVGFLSHFCERGQFSGHCYQSHVNHRTVKAADLVSSITGLDGRATKPLTYSLVSNEPQLQFGMNNPIAFYFHGIKTCVGLERPNMRSNIWLHYQPERENGASDVNNLSVISDRLADQLTGAEFKRCLRFFNRKWMKKDDNGRLVEQEDSTRPGLPDLVQFCALFQGEDFRTEGGFQSFLDKFNLRILYNFEKEVELNLQYRHFGILLRSLVPMRCGIYDGQHRFLVLALAMTGYYTPSASMKLDGDTGFNAHYGLQYSSIRATSQCYKKFKLQVGIVTGAVNIDEACMALRGVGGIGTAAQANNFGLGWKLLLTNVCMQYLEEFDSLDIAEVTRFDQFWSHSVNSLEAVEANQEKIWNTFLRVVEADEAMKRFIVKGFTEKTWIAMKEAGAKRMKDYSYLPSAPDGCLGGIGRDLMYFLQSLKSVCHSRDDVRGLISLFDQQNPRCPQRDDTDKNDEQFHTMSWFRQFVHVPLYYIYNKGYQPRLLTERRIIEVLRGEHIWTHPCDSEKKAIPLRLQAVEVIANGAHPDKGFDFACLHQPKLVWFKSKRIQQKNMRLKTSHAQHKMEVAGVSAMFNGVIRSIMQYGYDPVIKGPVGDSKLSENIELYLE